jgi:hypothetical protein
MPKVDITIRRRPRRPDEPARGPLATRRQADELPRRLSGYVNFYDCGQIWDGSAWKDWTFTIDPNEAFTSTTADPIAVIDGFDSSAWAAWSNNIFAIDAADWRTKYRKIDFADSPKFGVSVYNGRGGILSNSTTPDPLNMLGPDNPEWSGRGLKPIDKNNILVQNTGPLCLGFNTYDTTNFKVTAVQDYSAPTVAVDLAKGADIFLIPRPLFPQAIQEIGVGAAGRFAYLWAGWSTAPREIFFEKTLKRFVSSPFAEVPFFQGYFANDPYESGGAWMFDAADIGDLLAADLANWIKTRSNSNLYVQRGFPTTSGTYGYESLANFPFAGSGPQPAWPGISYLWEPEVSQFFRTAQSGVHGNRPMIAGILIAVIKTGQSFKYVWTNSNSEANKFWERFAAYTSPEP